MRVLLAAILLTAGCVSPAIPPAAPEPAISCDAPCVQEIATSPNAREPIVAQDPRDPSHLVAASMTFDITGQAVGKLHLQTHDSRDGGATWTTTAYALPGATAATETYDAALAWLDDGSLVVGGVALEGAYSIMGPAQGNSRIFAAHASDVATIAQGSGAEIPAFGLGGGLRGLDKPSLVANGSAMLAAYAERADGRMRLALARSNDAGQTWAPVEAPASTIDSVPGLVVAARDGWVVPYATFDGASDLQARRFHCFLAIAESTYSVRTPIDLGPCTWVAAAATRGDEIDVAIPHGGATDLLRSADQGATWSPPLALDPRGADGEEIPALAAIPDGSLVALLAHPTSQGNASFLAARIIGDRASAPLWLEDVPRSASQLGDYFGLSPAPGGAFAAWVDVKDDAHRIVGAHMRWT